MTIATNTFAPPPPPPPPLPPACACAVAAFSRLPHTPRLLRHSAFQFFISRRMCVGSLVPSTGYTNCFLSAAAGAGGGLAASAAAAAALSCATNSRGQEFGGGRGRGTTRRRVLFNPPSPVQYVLRVLSLPVCYTSRLPRASVEVALHELGTARYSIRARDRGRRAQY